MKMFLTRLGEHSRMVVTGDRASRPAARARRPGLAEATRLLDRIEGIGHVILHRRRRYPPRTGAANCLGLRPGGRAARARKREDQENAPGSHRAARDIRRPFDRGHHRPPRSGASGRTPKPSFERAVSAAAEAASTPRTELAIVLTDDSAIRALNRAMARQERADQRAVVSGRGDRAKAGPRPPYTRRHRHRLSRPPRGRRSPKASRSTIISRILPSMDFSICWATITRTIATHRTMERLERKILARLAVPDPYAHEPEFSASCLTPTRPAVRLSRPANTKKNLPVPVKSCRRRDRRLLRAARARPVRLEERADPRRHRSGARGRGSRRSRRLAGKRTMIRNILALRGRRIEDVMVPRGDIVAVQQDITIGQLVKVFEKAAHSRLVAYNDTLDDPIGMVHIRDLIAFMTARPLSTRTSRRGARSSAPPASILASSTCPCRCRRPGSCARCCSCRRRCRRSTCSRRCRPPGSIWR